jgi:hypothetical protein
VTTVVVFGKDEEVEVEVEEVEVCHETSTFFAVRGERERERERALVLGLVDNTKATRPKNRKEVGAFSVMVCDFLFFFFYQNKLN